MGGFAAVLAGLTTAVGAIVAFYPGMLVSPRPGLQLTPLVENIPRLAAATQIHYAANDHAISADDREAVKRALAASKCVHQVVVHDGAEHGFHSHDRASYHPQAAEDAWHETLAWLKENLA
jgi:carboxymethylenebutenolidase